MVGGKNKYSLYRSHQDHTAWAQAKDYLVGDRQENDQVLTRSHHVPAVKQGTVRPINDVQITLKQWYY